MSYFYLNFFFSKIQEELKQNQGKIIDDPFTRRSTRPTMFSERKDSSLKETKDSSALPVTIENAPKVAAKEKDSPPEIKKKQNTDLFNAHNFDIMIDLEVPVTSK